MMTARLPQSPLVPIVCRAQLPVGSRTSSTINGSAGLSTDVFVAAKTRPPYAFRLMWSSAISGPLLAVSVGFHVVSGCPSWWTAKLTVCVSSLLHMTPILLPPNAITPEVSSTVTLDPLAGSTNGVPQLLSSPLVRLTRILFPCCHVAHSLPVESLSITRVSVL